jgi:hypothetical protein
MFMVLAQLPLWHGLLDLGSKCVTIAQQVLTSLVSVAMLIYMAHRAQSPLKQKGNIILTALLIILVIAVVVLVGIGIKRRHDREKAAAVVTPTTAATTTTTAPPAATLSPGTDNASLDDDLANVNASLTLNGQSLSSANTAVNDQQSQITVPTN